MIIGSPEFIQKAVKGYVTYRILGVLGWLLAIPLMFLPAPYGAYAIIGLVVVAVLCVVFIVFAYLWAWLSDY